MNLEDLCINLAKADDEEEVIKILKDKNYWDNPSVWRLYNDSEDNFSTIGNQGSRADIALVEKIINSIDAMLLLECKKRGIDPESNFAPQNMKEAQIKFFNIPDGKLSNLTTTERSNIASNVFIVSTGKKTNPCYTIIDKGEGQTPEVMPNTFLSLNKGNKIRIPFVQGKFHMGSTGAFQFCGYNNIQLIISKRNPEIALRETAMDSTSDYWGFTIIRRYNPKDRLRNSVYKYLAPNNKILRFKATSLPLLPSKYPNAYENPLKWGSFIKLYNYHLEGLKSPIYFDFYYRFSVLLPNIVLPITLHERRKDYKADSYHIVLSGLSVRLDEDKKENQEDDFPSTADIRVMGQNIKVHIYAFKKDKSRHYTKSEGVIFIINGQSHGFLDKSFFSRKTVGMDYIKDSVLVIADCTNFEGRIREDLFMNSRDRLRDIELKSVIEKRLEELLSHHQGLRDLKARRIREDIEGRIREDKPIAEILNSVLKKNPTLSQYLIEGIRIQNPFKTIPTGISKKPFKGKEFPTYFIIKGDLTKENPKQCHINMRFRVQFETDAENEYIDRDRDPGEFELLLEDKEVDDRVLHFWNGIANLTVSLPKKTKVGDLFHYIFKITDISRYEPFIFEFYVKVIEPCICNGNGNGERAKPPGNKKKDKKNREKSNGFSLPITIEVDKNHWDEHSFTENSSIVIKDTGEQGYVFFINIDNVDIYKTLKDKPNIDLEILRTQYKSAMVFMGLSLLNGLAKQKESNDETVLEKISRVTDSISPVLLPTIIDLGKLNKIPV